MKVSSNRVFEAAANISTMTQISPNSVPLCLCVSVVHELFWLIITIFGIEAEQTTDKIIRDLRLVYFLLELN